MKKLIILFLILMTLLLFACQNETKVVNKINASDTDNSGKGKTVFTITDAAADMNSVTSVKMKIDNIKVYSESKGWTTVSSDTRTYDLLELKAESRNALIANVEMEEGTYSKMELEISEVLVVDSNGTHQTKLPSNKMTLEGQLIVEKSSTSTVSFDVLLDESLHTTQEGEYVMAPVIDLETRSKAEVNLASENDVKVYGGKVTTDVQIGMDINGNVGIGLKIPTNVVLSINGGIISNLGTAVTGNLGLTA